MFRATGYHADANGQGTGIVVGDWGIWRKVEATGAGVGNASAKIQKDWGGDLVQIQGIERNNNCFYTN